MIASRPDRIPTESRIFADRYFREARRIETLHASRISPGATTWRDALSGLFRRMDKVGSPIKQVALIKQAIAILDSIDPKEAMHISFVGHARSRRAAGLVFAAFSAGSHPLKGVDEEGLLIMQHAIMTARAGADLRAGTILTYVSKHAMSRLHERNHCLTAGAAFNVFGFLGILGLLTRHSDNHINGEVCLRYDDVLCVGSIKHARQSAGDGRAVDGSFYDVRTALPADEDGVDRAKLAQGVIAYEAVAEWFATRDPRKIGALAAKIPYLPRREDFTLRAAASN